MNLTIVQELKPYSREQLENIFNKEALPKSVIDSLVQQNILRRLSNINDSLELELLLDYEVEDDQIDRANIYIFKFVGLIMIGDTCLFVYPKYIEDIKADEQNGFKKFKQILEVIRKYNAKEQRQHSDGEGDVKEFNLLSYTLNLLQNYHEHGLYSNNKTIIEENGMGQILWNKTINEQNMYIINSIPMYLDLFTQNDVLNEEDLFRRLHKAVLTETCLKLEDLLTILDITPVTISEESVENFGNDDYIVSRLKQELRQQFITSKQAVLHYLIDYIERDKTAQSIDTISFVGTSSFHTIWEDVCATVYDNCLNKKVSDLGLKTYDDVMEHITVGNLIPKPKWHHHESQTTHTALKTLIPDIISIDKEKNTLSIYDAKYYNIKLDKYGVKKQPGIGDLSKQYLYALSYVKLAKANNLTIDKNAFLMPIDGDEEKELGYAKLELFNGELMEDICENIDIILLPCEKVFKEYLEK